MLKREGQKRSDDIRIVCDSCGDSALIKTPDLDKAITHAERAGWVVTLIEGIYVHWCSTCDRKASDDHEQDD